ncbi:MAG: porin family protein [Bacteroidota bacterium]
MRSFYLLLLAVAGCTAAHARIGFGPLVGLNISDYNKEIYKKDIKTQLKLGGRLGILFDIPFSNHLSLQPGINYVTNGYKAPHYVTTGYNVPLVPAGEIVWIINTVEVPVNLEYKFGDSCDNHFFVGGGPFVAWNKGGRLHLRGNNIGGSGGPIDTKRDVYVGTAPSDDIKPWDVGFGVNVGYEFKEGLFARAHYQMGFLNLQPTGNDDNALRNYNFGLSIGYFFHTKAKVKNKAKYKDDDTKVKYKDDKIKYKDK